MKTTLRKSAILAFVLALLCASNSLMAQSRYRSYLGIKGGVSLLPDSPAAEVYPGIFPNRPIFGAFFGGFDKKSPEYSVGLEVLYLAQSAFYDVSGSEVECTRKYLQLLPIFKFRFTKKSRITPVLFAGAGFTFLLKTSRSPDIEDPLNPEFKDVLYSAVFGGGLDAEVGRFLISLDVRYDLGEDALGIRSKDPKPNALLFTAGIGWRLGRG